MRNEDKGLSAFNTQQTQGRNAKLSADQRTFDKKQDMPMPAHAEARFPQMVQGSRTWTSAKPGLDPLSPSVHLASATPSQCPGHPKPLKSEKSYLDIIRT